MNAIFSKLLGSAQGSTMTSESDTSDVRISNWTSATGTRPGERHVYPTRPQDNARVAARGDRS